MLVNRLKKMRARRLVAALCVAAVGGTGSTAGATAPPSTQPRPAAADRAPGEESLSERRAVRGSPVDDVAVPETPELRELRRFEEQAFPRAGATPPPPSDGAPPAPSLPGSWGGSGDVPPELR